MIDAAFDRVSRRYRIRRPSNVAFRTQVFHALMRTPDVEGARAIPGVPLRLIRRFIQEAMAWGRSRLAGGAAHAFTAETGPWFVSGFARERCVCLARR